MRSFYSAIRTTLIALAVGSGAAQGAEDGSVKLPASESDSAPRAITGVVVSTVAASGYTYLQIDTDDGIIWAAVPRIAMKEGERVILPDGYPMSEFYSPSLDRRYEVLYMATSVRILGGGREMPATDDERDPPGGPKGTTADPSDIEIPREK